MSMASGSSSGNGRAEQDALELRKHQGEQIFAAEVGDDALLDLAVLAVGLDDAYVLVDGAVGGRDFDGADEHEVSITTILSNFTIRNGRKWKISM
jgi:hypothetical protein